MKIVEQVFSRVVLPSTSISPQSSLQAYAPLRHRNRDDQISLTSSTVPMGNPPPSPEEKDGHDGCAV
jgi:hypothetical protein